MDWSRQGGYVRLENRDAIVSRLAQQDKDPWYRKPNLRLLYLLMIPACLGVEMTSGFDASMINGLQAVPSWLEYFHHPHSALLGFMIAMYPLGFATAVPFVPSVVDKIGRRYPILFGSIIVMLGGILQGCAMNVAMFITARFILGFAIAFSAVAASSLIAELAHPNERAVMCSLFHNSFDLGAVAAAVVILGTFTMSNDWGWRIPSFLQALLSLLQFSFIWFIPESPRWLVSQGRGKEAFATLVKYHAEGDEDSEFVNAEYTQIVQTLEAEQKITEMNWVKTFSTPGMQKRTSIAIFLGLSTHWCGFGMVLYFFSPILDTIGIHDNHTKNIINVVKVCWSLVAGTLSAFIAPRYPRRKIYLISTIAIFVIFTAWTVASAEYSLTHNKISAQVALVLIFLYIPAYDLGFNIIIFAYLVELFPFHVRTRGLSIYQWFARMAGFVSLVMNPIGIESIGWKWYLVYCVWNMSQIVFVYLMLPETSGRTLEELTSLYESDDTVGEDESLRSRAQVGIQYGAVDDNSRRTAH